MPKEDKGGNLYPMEMVLKTQKVSLRRNNRNILDGVDIEIKAGEHWAVIGPNGAGKTTLMKLFSGRLHPSAGQVEILGETLGKVDVSELRSRIGLTSAALVELIGGSEKVRDVVLSAAYGTAVRWRQEFEEVDFDRAQALLEIFEVDSYADRSFGTLSEGEKQRVMLARALMADPEVLLLDEPTSGLDLGGREELLTALAELAAYPNSPVMVLVTHHLEQIPVGFTHALVLKDGQVYRQGPINEVLTAPILSQAFGTELHVGTEEGRWWARAAVKKDGEK